MGKVNSETISRLGQYMKLYKFRQSDVAKHLGISQACLSSYLSSKKGYAMDSEMLKKICDYMHISADDVALAIELEVPSSKIDDESVFERYLCCKHYDITHVHEVLSIPESVSKMVVASPTGVIEQYVISDNEDEYYLIKYGTKTKKVTSESYHSFINDLAELNLTLIRNFMR